MQQADLLAGDWLGAKPNTDVFLIGLMNTKNNQAGHLPKDICYSIWSGETKSLPKETLNTQAPKCDYLAERLAQTAGAFGYPVNNPIVMKSKYLRDIVLNYNSHKIDCIIGKLDSSKLVEWDTDAPTRALIDGQFENKFYSCEGKSPYAFDKDYKRYNDSIQAMIDTNAGVPALYKKKGYEEADYPLWKGEEN